MNKLYLILTFLVGFVLIEKVVASDVPVVIINSPVVISGNQTWSGDYYVSSNVSIIGTSTLNILSGSRIFISNNASFIVNGGTLNVGQSIPVFSDLSKIDDIFVSNDMNIIKIDISGIGYDNVFNIKNSGVVNFNKVYIEGHSDLQRTVFGLSTNSKFNGFDVVLNNIEVRGTQVFYLYDKSRVVFYNSNVNGFYGKAFSNVFNESELDVVKTKLNDIGVDSGINLFNKSTLNFFKSSISAVPLYSDSDSSGVCINGNNGTNINVNNSEIGPCFIAFSFFGSGEFIVNDNNIVGNSDAILNFSTAVDFKNNWWGRREGPRLTDLSSLDPDGNYSTADYINVIRGQNGIEDYTNGVVYIPFSSVPFRESSCCSSVLFIPGIQASRLYKKGYWGTENQLWEPNRNKDVESLSMNLSGESLDSKIYTRDIILKTNFFGSLGSVDIYQSLFDFFKKEKDEGDIGDFKTLAYDWRYLPSSILSGIKTDSGVYLLKDEIKKLASSSPSGKVIIVAHSYGGLLAKYLLEALEREGDDNLIESTVLVSVPEYGTPQAITSLFYGDNEDLLGGIILSKKTAISFGRNLLSAHLLLPSKTYFKVDNFKNVIKFDPWVESKIGTMGYFSDFIKSKNIISKNFNVNGFVFDKANTEHELIDNYSNNLSSKTYSIVPVGIPTLSSLTYVKPRCRGFFFCNYNDPPDFNREYSLMGDGVVIAHDLSLRTGSVFTVDIGKENEDKKISSVFFKEDPISHKDIFRSSGVISILHAVLSRSRKESQKINSFNELNNPYVSYVSGSLSKPGPILGSYGDSSMSKIKDDASDSEFVSRFSNSKIIKTEGYGPVVFKINYNIIDEIKNNSFDILSLKNRVVNYTTYSDNNRSGIVSAVSCNDCNSNILAQGDGVGIVQIISKIDNTEIVYPSISVTPSTSMDINSSTTTISVDSNADGVIDKKIFPIQVNKSSTSESIDIIFEKARVRIKDSVSSGLLGSSSIYLVNKYVEKINIIERKYHKTSLMQSLDLLKSFSSSMESNMLIISNLINRYNKEIGFNGLTAKKVIFLNQRQREIREEILVYTEIHDAYFELGNKMGEGL